MRNLGSGLGAMHWAVFYMAGYLYYYIGVTDLRYTLPGR
jgi:hypothetical protein